MFTFAAVLMFLALPDIHEPSAIQQLPDGRLLIAEDEKARPFSLLTLGPQGPSAPTALELGEAATELGKLDDLEGLAADPAGNVYAITSHSRDGDGDEKRSREKLVRFRVDGDRVVGAQVQHGLKAALSAAHPVLARAAEVRNVKADGGLNIEALELSPDGRLLIGFRSPLREGRALLATLTNPGRVFDAGVAPAIDPHLEALDLGGDGLRGMAWVPALGGYLLISGPVARENVQFKLWYWAGHGHPPRRADVPGLSGLEHAEGITPLRLGGESRLIVVSDDGDRKAGRAARYLLLKPEQLVIRP